MPHLILSRKLNERFRLMTSDGPIWIEVVKIDRGKVRIRIGAPECVEVMREELLKSEDESPMAELGGELHPG